MGLISQKGGASAPSTSEAQEVRRWGYRKKDGEVEGKIFTLAPKEKLPKGWVDTPAKVKL